MLVYVLMSDTGNRNVSITASKIKREKDINPGESAAAEAGRMTDEAPASPAGEKTQEQKNENNELNMADDTMGTSEDVVSPEAETADGSADGSSAGSLEPGEADAGKA